MAAIGLLLLVGASVIAGAGIGANRGDGGTAPVSFDLFGYYPFDSSTQLFVGGIALGAVAMLGLAMIVVGLRRRASAHRAVRRERAKTRRETKALARERDGLAAELESTRTDTAAGSAATSTSPTGPNRSTTGLRGGWLARRRHEDDRVGADSV